MRKFQTSLLLTSCLATLAFIGCGSDSTNNKGGTTTSADIVIQTRISDTTGFLDMVDGSKEQTVTSSNGEEIEPPAGIFSYNGFIYTTGFRQNDKLAKYSVQEDGSLKKEIEVAVGESSLPSSLIFVNDTKAYLLLIGSGELLVINPTNLKIQKRIDLSSYAMGENDTNPEPAGGVIREGKLYLALSQIDSFQTWKCRGKASVLIIDVASDDILKHITDDRTCLAEFMPNQGLILDEKGDIYINNTASWGYYPNLNAGYLRIKNGEDEFDSDYFFSITDLTDLDIEGGKASYAYFDNYLNAGKTYTTLMVPGLTSSPPDYVKDKNFQPYVLDLYNQTATKLNLPASAGSSASSMIYNGEVIYGLATENGRGLYKIGEDTPYIKTDGAPFYIIGY